MIAIDKLVLIIIFLIILAIGVFLLVGFVEPSGEQINFQNEIRLCCTLYRAASEDGRCPTDRTVLETINCGSDNLRNLIDKVGMTPQQLCEFCNCLIC